MPDINISVIDTSGLAKPLSKLVNLAGNVLKPWLIRAEAQAEADAEVTKARGENRAARIRCKSEPIQSLIWLRQQRNIEQIILKAEQLVSDAQCENPVDEDWAANFFDHAQHVGDAEMQTLWAKILAGEVERGGSFSLRTLATVRQMQQADAHLFTKFCASVWCYRGTCYPIRVEAFPYAECCIRMALTELMHLEDIGLIHAGGLQPFEVGESTDFELSYFDVRFSVKPPPGVTRLQLGEYVLTSAGQELAKIAGSTPQLDYRDALVAGWRAFGHEVVQL